MRRNRRYMFFYLFTYLINYDLYSKFLSFVDSKGAYCESVPFQVSEQKDTAQQCLMFF